MHVDPHEPPKISAEQDAWEDVATAMVNAALKLAMHPMVTPEQFHATCNALVNAACFQKLAMTFDDHVCLLRHDLKTQSEMHSD